MIEFRGKVLDEIIIADSLRKAKRFYKWYSIYTLVAIGLFLPMVIVEKLWPLFGLVGIMLLPLILLPFRKIKIKNREVADSTYELIISKNYMKCVWGNEVVHDGEIFLEKLKKVIDYGSYYLLEDYIMVPKGLLVTGTLEEFEKLFEGKIIRRVKPIQKEDQL